LRKDCSFINIEIPVAGVKYYIPLENSSVRIIMDTKIINYPISLYETF